MLFVAGWLLFDSAGETLPSKQQARRETHMVSIHRALTVETFTIYATTITPSDCAYQHLPHKSLLATRIIE